MQLLVKRVQATFVFMLVINHVHHRQHEREVEIVSKRSCADETVDAAPELLRPVDVFESVLFKKNLHMMPLQVNINLVLDGHVSQHIVLACIVVFNVPITEE